jgi:hypothetical protein
MQGIAKRVLALAAATSGLVLVTAGAAAADAAVSGSANDSGGLGSGNTANLAGSLPAEACGNQALLIALKDTDAPQMCAIRNSSSATAAGSSNFSPGFVSGDVTDVAVSAPVETCGDQADVIADRDSVGSSKCSEAGGSASAVVRGASDGGVLSGNVTDVAVSAPVEVCGDQVDAIAFGDTVAGSECSIG